MIDPFSAEQVAKGTISYGLSSYGYDLRLADEFKIFAPPAGQLIDPKAIPAELPPLGATAQVVDNQRQNGRARAKP